MSSDPTINKRQRDSGSDSENSDGQRSKERKMTDINEIAELLDIKLKPINDSINELTTFVKSELHLLLTFCEVIKKFSIIAKVNTS
jgi:hypothetical protein